MSERGHFRSGGGRGGGRGGVESGHRGRGGGGGGGGRGASRGGGSGLQQQQQHHQEKPRKENILDLAKYMDKQVSVKFNGGREVVGTLKGYDQLMNLVLDDVKETMRDDQGNESSRSLGLIVARGTLLVLMCPVDGSEEIANPFQSAED